MTFYIQLIRYKPIQKYNKTYIYSYNILDLYLVSSRLEGGPQAILECAVSKTPIISTDVGVASEILHPNSIYSLDNFEEAKPMVEYAYENSKKFTLPEGMNRFREMFSEIYES